MKAPAGAPPAPPDPTMRWRPHPLDLLAVVLAVTGAGCALSGLLPRAETTTTLHRILPLLLFLGTVIVLAELTAVAGVFDVLASRLAIASRGRWAALFLLCGGLATLTTLVLNLDTTSFRRPRTCRTTRCCTASRSPAACSSSPASSPGWRSASPPPSR
ncbi:hypothetical protein AB0J84_09505 [Micromonospora arborensis]|uniref:hypothetical protein n=1 Tax=Micromonospora arborensis TaxID=2116518 RepID=UPI00343618B3